MEVVFGAGGGIFRSRLDTGWDLKLHRFSKYYSWGILQYIVTAFREN
jgi:hypothetical protein